MKNPNENGFVGHDKPAQTNTKTSHYFIAICEALGSPTGGMFTAMAVILVQVALSLRGVA